MDISDVVIPALSAAFAAGGAYLGVKVELRYMRRDIDNNKNDLDKLRDEKNTDVKLLHERISRRQLRADG